MIKIAPLILLLFCACSSTISNKDSLLLADFTEGDVVLSPDSFEFKFIALETIESCLFGDIGQIEIVNNRIYIIDRTNDLIFVFSIDGTFIAQIGTKGNGPGEYIMPKTLHVDEKNHIISVVDLAQGKMIHYDLETYQYISNQKIRGCNDCAWLIDGNIAWFNQSGYVTDKRESYYIEITDSELNHLNYYYTADILTGYGISIGRRFHQYDGHTFLSIPFFSTVYEVTTQGIVPSYDVMFGKHYLPSHDWLLTHLSNDQNYIRSLLNSEYISAFNLNETDSYLATTYCAENKNCYIAFYNKETKRSYKYSAEEFIKIIGFDGVSHILGAYNNYFIVAIYPSELKKSSIKNEGLRSISEKIEVDSNFILCLFKVI